MVPHLIGASALDRESLWYRLRPFDLPLAPQANAILDIALWDLAAKHAGLPLYRMLGGPRSKILAYASTPLLHTAEAYVDYVAELKERGFTAAKFHCWCEVDKDMAMARAVSKRFGDSGMHFMLDVEQRYTARTRSGRAASLASLATAGSRRRSPILTSPVIASSSAASTCRSSPTATGSSTPG